MSDLQSLKTILNEKEIGKTSGKRGLADELGFILGLFSAWKIALFVQTFLALTRFPLGKIDPGFYNLVVGIWAKTWDAGNYLSITKVGYTEQTYAFFPLLPLLTRLVTEVTRLDTAVIGVVIVNLAIFFALFVFDGGEYYGLKTAVKKYLPKSLSFPAKTIAPKERPMNAITATIIIL